MSKTRLPPYPVLSAACACCLLGAVSSLSVANDMDDDEDSAPKAELFCELEHDGLSCETDTRPRAILSPPWRSGSSAP